jgi:hypothetical protein
MRMLNPPAYTETMSTDGAKNRALSKPDGGQIDIR